MNKKAHFEMYKFQYLVFLSALLSFIFVAVTNRQEVIDLSINGEWLGVFIITSLVPLTSILLALPLYLKAFKRNGRAIKKVVVVLMWAGLIYLTIDSTTSNQYQGHFMEHYIGITLINFLIAIVSLILLLFLSLIFGKKSIKADL